jgi:hypothetical protein
MSRSLAATTLCIALLTSAVPTVAHHSVWAEFDNGQPVEMKGRFIKMDWLNPHSWVHMEVTMEDGSIVEWAAETPPPNQLIRQGWRRSDLQPGDELLIRGFVARNGTKRLWAQNVAITAQNGTQLPEPRTVLALFEQNPNGIPEGLLPGRD